MHNLILLSEAVVDIQVAFEWYEQQRAGLGYELIEEIEAGFEKITQHPQYYTSVNDVFRRLKVNRFPYIIVYEIEDKEIIVNSVRHTSRKSAW